MDVETDDDVDNNLPEFFNVYIHHLTFHRMLIPREFVCYIGRTDYRLVRLAGPSGRTWRVQLVEDGKDLYFTDGWRDFVIDNLVREGNFMFFKYHGDLKFSVVIYDESMCEKRRELNDECSQDEDDIVEIGEEENRVPTVKKRNYFQPKQEVGDEENGFPIGEVDKTGEQIVISFKPSFQKTILGSFINIPKSFLVENSLSYNSNEKMVLRTNGNKFWEVNIIKCPTKITFGTGWAAFTRENCIRVGDICKFELLGRLEMMVQVANQKEGIRQKKVNMKTSKMNSLKRAAVVSQPEDICEGQSAAARTLSSYAKPSFTVVMKNYNIVKHFMLHIPGWFIRENSLNYKPSETMILQTEKDSFWAVHLIRDQHTNYHRFSRGWAAFVQDNNIKTGDTCKFELLKRLEMKVHIKATS